MTAVLGISAFYHDAAAALVVDGEVVAASQEERFSRVKNDAQFPTRAIEACLDQAGLHAENLDYVGFYDKPYRKFDRLLMTYLAYAPRGYGSFAEAMPTWLKSKLWLPREMREGLGDAYVGPFAFLEHHESHAASAFFPSPFDRAAILTFDGVGEWATASFGRGEGARIELSHELRFPHSLGLLYTAFTSYAGFQVNSDEYKLMGLAPFGEPRFSDVILEKLVDLKDDGSFRMDMSYFDYAAGLRMTSEKFHALFGGPPRQPESEITQRDMDVAASIQQVTEEILLRSARHVHASTGEKNLCLSGGVALNCVANGRILREGPFDNIWIQPAAGDAGSALGAALFVWHQLLENERTPCPNDAERGALLGPSHGDDEIESFLAGTNATYTRIDDDAELTERVAELLANGNVVAWFQGAMEFGPRALGARSILADPRGPDTQQRINHMVKFREGFRPFAPAVLAERAGEYFALDEVESPYMLLVCPVQEEQRTASTAGERTPGFGMEGRPHSTIPAVTHVDGSARVQTVDAERMPLYRQLLEAFDRKTGCPVLVNTSFNLSWEPIVCTPRDAYRAFMSSGLDALCIGHFVLTKPEQRVRRHVAAGGERRPERFVADLLASPCCGAEFDSTPDALTCQSCQHVFPIEEGIPRLFWPHEGMQAGGDPTDAVKSFYEETPFPDYSDHDTLRSLIDKSRTGAYARALDEAIPFNSDVLEVGCGTGQLSNFLGIGCRRMIGADLCLNSLRLSEAFRSEHGLDTTAFLQMNLLRPTFRKESFDVVICNGVLMTLADEYEGFRSIVELLKPGGHIVIGLYNRWGRLMTDLRRQIFRVTGGRGRWIDPYLRRPGLSEAKRRAWYADQYLHPAEKKHTIGEVQDWFDRSGVDFLRGIPPVTPDADPLPGEGLFTPEAPGTSFDHGVVQAIQIATGSLEGGFYISIGRKRE